MKKSAQPNPWDQLEAIEREIVNEAIQSKLVADVATWQNRLAEDHLGRSDVADAVAEANERLTEKLHEAKRRGSSRVVDRWTMTSHRWSALDDRRRAVESEVVQDNMALVHFFAQRYASRYEHDDLAQEGSLGLLRAVQKFEHWRGVRFSTYASLWIRQAMQRASTQKAPIVRVPVYQTERRRQIARVVERYNARGSAPSNEEIANALSCSVDDVTAAVDANVQVSSFDAEIGPNGGGASLHHLATDDRSPESTASLKQQALMVRTALASLASRDQVIVSSRYGIDTLPTTLAEIGNQLGLSRERVRQLEGAALERLRRNVVRRGLAS